MDNKEFANQQQDKIEKYVEKTTQSALSMGFLCALASVGLIAFELFCETGYGGGDVVLVFLFPFLIIAPVAVIMCVKSLKKAEMVRQRAKYEKLFNMAVVGLLCALSFPITIVVSFLISAMHSGS